MAKYVELPKKPAKVNAVQFVGMENGLPLWGEAAPSWILEGFVKGTLSVVDGNLFVDGKSADLGSWLVVDTQGPTSSDGMWTMSDSSFTARYRPARKKAVRKPRALKEAA